MSQPVQIVPTSYKLFQAELPGMMELCNAFKLQYMQKLEKQKREPIGAQTPRYGGRTPGGARTPAVGGRTPGVARTPAAGLGGRTPMPPHLQHFSAVASPYRPPGMATPQPAPVYRPPGMGTPMGMPNDPCKPIRPAHGDCASLNRLLIIRSSRCGRRLQSL
jgi:transcription elongation factor SPT6